MIVPAAMLLARDSADAQLDRHQDWARLFLRRRSTAPNTYLSHEREKLFASTLSRPPHSASSTCGAAAAVTRTWDILFELVVRDDPSAAQGFGAGVSILRGANWRIVAALLRCALLAQVRPRHGIGTTRRNRRPSAKRSIESGSLRLSRPSWLGWAVPGPSRIGPYCRL